MKMYSRAGTGEKRRFEDLEIEDEEAVGALCRMSNGQVEEGGPVDSEKRKRREIANHNERRRMQSINAGFSTLRAMLPNSEGEKLSKAAILQQTADYIIMLEQDRKELKSENEQLKRIIQHQEINDASSSSDGEGPMSEILSTIQDLRQSGLVASKETTHKLCCKPSKNGNASSLLIETKRVKQEEESERLQEAEHRSKRRRSSADDKNRPLKKYASLKNPEPKPEEKKKGVEYSSVVFGLEEPKVVSMPRCYTITPSAHHITNTTNTTILTILPSSTPPHTMLPRGTSPQSALQPIALHSSILKPNRPSEHRMSTEVRRPPVSVAPKVEVEPASRISTPDDVEYSDAEQATLQLHVARDGFMRPLVHPSPTGAGQSCQKSLDTICEAIRHLEGDHMFAASEDHVIPAVAEEHVLTTSEESFNTSEEHMISADDGCGQIKLQEEQVITDGTFPLHDPANGSIIYEDVAVAGSGAIVQHSRDGVYEICSSPSQFGHSGNMQHRLQLYPNTTMVYGMDEHMTPDVSLEPQEAPLELTTTHRLERHLSSPPRPPHSTATPFLQAGRPGVIVVKQA